MEIEKERRMKKLFAIFSYGNSIEINTFQPDISVVSIRIIVIIRHIFIFVQESREWSEIDDRVCR